MERLFDELLGLVGTLLMWGLVIIAVVVIFAIVSEDRKLKKYENKTSSGAGNAVKPRGTGCLSSLSCRHMDLGKAKKAGKPSNMCYCGHYKDYVTRCDHCEHFYPRGCKTGMCHYANLSGQSCYCEYYGKNVTPMESCPYYFCYFDTEDGKAFLDSLVPKK